MFLLLSLLLLEFYFGGSGGIIDLSFFLIDLGAFVVTCNVFLNRLRHLIFLFIYEHFDIIAVVFVLIGLPTIYIKCYLFSIWGANKIVIGESLKFYF